MAEDRTLRDTPRAGWQVAAGRDGMVATSAPGASAAGATVLAAGGNAVDAAVAACLALGVADPANTSLFGRCHLLVGLAGGAIHALDGATRQPASVPPLAGPGDRRAGHATVPVPGNPAALATASRRWGRLGWADLVAPARELAGRGFPVTRRLAAAWQAHAGALARDDGARRHYLRPDGGRYREGEIFRHPALADLLDRLARSGPRELAEGALAERLAAEVRAGGGFLEAADLAGYAPAEGEVIRAHWRGAEVATLGGQAWGHSLLQMLGMLEALGGPRPDPGASAELALLILFALGDRPEEIGTLRRKPDGMPLSRLIEPGFQRRRAAEVRRALAGAPDALAKVIAAAAHWPQGPGDGHTTHFSVIDREGNAVAGTTSIGPHFGSRVCSPGTGVLFAHSYRMASDPEPGARDRTEMTPCLVRRDGRVVLAAGAAGSERIPGATAQVVAGFLAGGDLGAAMAGPRLNWSDGRLYLGPAVPAEVREHLQRTGFPVVPDDAPHEAHLGIAHAVAFDPGTEMYAGAVDPASDGTAAGPGAQELPA